MKKIIYILIALLGLSLMTACGDGSSSGDESSPLYGKIAGEWHLTTWSGTAPAGFDAYIDFRSDRTFEIYQKIETTSFKRYSGSYRIDGTVVSGVYSDGKAWGSSYEISFDASDKKLTMTSNTSIPEVGIYTRGTIPSTVKQGATAASAQAVRSDEFRLL